MITTIIGRTFLKAYNTKYGTQYSAKEFFGKEYFELFFNHPKYMQWVTNSPFVQMKSGQKPHLLSVAERQEKLENLYEKVEHEEADASFAIGYPASEDKEYASTSGLVSDIVIDSEDEDIYNSWIGSGLGIGVAGGYNLLIDNPDVLLATFEGWAFYRKYLHDPALEKIRGNQINSWNGQWLTYRFGKDYRKDFNFHDLETEGIFRVSDTLIEVDTVNWSNLFFSLSNTIEQAELTAYIYSFGQTNKTIGFIPVFLRSGRRLIDVFKQLYHTDAPFSSRDFQSLFGVHIKRACEMGNIGLKALRPKDLSKYFKNDKNISFNKESDINNYQSFKTWLVAMLSKNKQEITDYTSEIATMLQRYREAGTKTDRKNLIEKSLLASSSKKVFLDALTEILVGIEQDDLPKLKKLRDEVHLMTNEEFIYFNTLLKFDYKFTEKNS